MLHNEKLKSYLIAMVLFVVSSSVYHHHFSFYNQSVPDLIVSTTVSLMMSFVKPKSGNRRPNGLDVGLVCLVHFLRDQWDGQFQ